MSAVAQLGKVTVAAIDDDPNSLAFLTAALEREDLEILAAATAAEGLDLVRRRHPQIALIDLIVPPVSGLELLDRILEIDPAIDVILIAGLYSTESAVRAIRKGACDYLEKSLPIHKLRERVYTLVGEAHRRERTQGLDDAMAFACSFEGIIGRSPPMLDVFARIRRVAPHYRTALITGETGTGKELAARALHRLSPVANGPFVVCNCAAIPESLVESELFGHTKGAFTGAVQEKAGLLAHAHGGTLFLDEIGEMPLATQPKLLRAIQHQEFQPVGSPVARKVNVRIIAATHRDLRALVKERLFRDDLFFRICMAEIRMPPLADHKDDLPLLWRHFVRDFASSYGKRVDGLTRRAEALLLRYAWPGNIRELENAIGFACMMTEGNRLDIHDFPGDLNAPTAHAFTEPELLSLIEMQRRHARQVVDFLDGDKTHAAAVLGVSRATLYRLLGPKVSTRSAAIAPDAGTGDGTFPRSALARPSPLGDR